MSILLAFQGAPPAEPDLIDLFIAVEPTEADAEETLAFVIFPIEDDAPILLIAVEPEPDDDPVADSFIDLLIEEDAPIELIGCDPPEADDEPAECFVAADIFVPEGGEEIIVIETATADDEDEPAWCFVDAPIDDAFVADPGEIIETMASEVYIEPDEDPNDYGWFVDSHAPFDDAPLPAAEGGDDYLVRARRRGRR
jgi:hypothetical protein